MSAKSAVITPQVLQNAYITDDVCNGVTCGLCGLHYEMLIGWKVWCRRVHTKEAESALQRIKGEKPGSKEAFSYADRPLSWWRQEYNGTTNKIWFGKHVGKDLAQVPAKYLEWLLKANPEVSNVCEMHYVCELPGFGDAIRAELRARRCEREKRAGKR